MFRDMQLSISLRLQESLEFIRNIASLIRSPLRMGSVSGRFHGKIKMTGRSQSFVTLMVLLFFADITLLILRNFVKIQRLVLHDCVLKKLGISSTVIFRAISDLSLYVWF